MTDQDHQLQLIPAVAVESDTTTSEPHLRRRKRRRRSAEGSLASTSRISNPRVVLTYAGLVAMVGFLGFCFYWVNAQQAELREVSQDKRRLEQTTKDLESKVSEIRISAVDMVELHAGENGDPGSPVRVPDTGNVLTLRLHVPVPVSGLREFVFLDEESRERARGRAKSNADGTFVINVMGLSKGKHEIVCRPVQIQQQKSRFKDPVFRFVMILS